MLHFHEFFLETVSSCCTEVTENEGFTKIFNYVKFTHHDCCYNKCLVLEAFYKAGQIQIFKGYRFLKVHQRVSQSICSICSITRPLQFNSELKNLISKNHLSLYHQNNVYCNLLKILAISSIRSIEIQSNSSFPENLSEDSVIMLQGGN